MPPIAYLGLVGAVIIFVWSHLFQKVRTVAPMFLGCAMCVGFWVGLGGSLVLQLHQNPFLHFLTACAVSLLSFSTLLVLKCLDMYGETP